MGLFNLGQIAMYAGQNSGVTACYFHAGISNGYGRVIV
jgi:hypothetical protein